LHRAEVRRNRTREEGGFVFGTPEYMPPEQARGEPVDARADITPQVILELLTTVPFDGDSPTRSCRECSPGARGAEPDRPEISPELTSSFSPPCEGAGERPQSAADFMTALAPSARWASRPPRELGQRPRCRCDGTPERASPSRGQTLNWLDSTPRDPSAPNAKRDVGARPLGASHTWRRARRRVVPSQNNRGEADLSAAATGKKVETPTRSDERCMYAKPRRIVSVAMWRPMTARHIEELMRTAHQSHIL
jgi:serine/threonine protein kinase